MKLLALFSLLTVHVVSAFVAAPQKKHHEISSIVDHPSLGQPLNVASLNDPLASGSSFASSCNPQALVSDFLDGLMHDPDTTHRMKLLLHSSTHNWRSKIYDAIGAPASANEDMVAEALGAAMQKVDNQFAILLGKGEEFEIVFPSDPVNYNDGKAWIECRLYSKKDGELLVVSGWELRQSPASGSWLFDRIDWQDFRDAFYPGLGREEWCRAFV